MRGASIAAGDLDRRIAFKRETTSENGFGEPSKTGLELITYARASVNYGQASQRRQAGIESNILPATFRARKNPLTASVTTKDVIDFDGGLWDIAGIVPFGLIGLDFTAIRRI